MALFSKPIDVTQGYFPCDPNSFPENLRFTVKEDSPTQTMPVLLYDGWNFLPTSYGYRSYFGLNSKLDVPALTSRCDGLLVFQINTYVNRIYAMCEDGLWTLSGGTWTHSYTLSIPAVGAHLEWTWCIIENILYMYREGNGVVYKVVPAGTLSAITPSFLTMAGQMGIFRANGRLGFWDSANSVSWSSLFDHTDFTPSLTTLAGNRMFNAVIGRIVVIRAKADGFVIYCTRRIVAVRYITTGTLLWDSDAITDDIGIAYPRQSTTGITDSDQYFYGGGALYAIGQYNQVSRSTQLVPVFPEVVDFLRETRDPIFLEFMGGRYLYLYLIDPRYVDGMVHFETHTVPVLSLEVLPGWDGTFADMPLTLSLVEIQQALHQVFLGNTAEQQTTKPNPTDIHPIWSVTATRCDANYRGIVASNYGVWGSTQDVNNAMVDTFFDGIDFSGWVEQEVIKLQIEDNLKSYTGTGFYPTRASAGARAVETLSEFTNVFSGQWYEYNERLKSILDRIFEYRKDFSYVHVYTPGSTWVNYAVSNGGSASGGTFPEPDGMDNVTGKGPTSIIVRPGRVTIRKHFTEYYRILENSCSVFSIPDMYDYSPIPGSDPTEYELVPGTVSVSITFGFHTVYPLISSFTTGLSVGAAAALRDSVLNDSWRDKDFLSVLVDRDFLNIPIEYLDPEIDEVTMNIYFRDGKQLSNGMGIVSVYLEYVNPTLHSIYGRFLAAENRLVCSITIGGTSYGPGATPSITYSENKVHFYSVEYIGCIRSKIDTVYTVTHWSDIEDALTAAVSVYSGPAEPDVPYCNKEGMVSFANPNVGVSVNRYDTGVPFPLSYLDPNLDYPSYSIVFPALSAISYPPYILDLPGATFNIQNGSIGPIYPIYAGALVYDMALKKWGKLKGQFKQLIEYSPVNKIDEGIVTYDNFGMDAGILDTSGYLRLFDINPSESLAKWGKIGYYRIGYTRSLVVIIHFRLPSTCTIKLEHSLDGRAINTDLTKEVAVSSALSMTFNVDVVGKWFNIVLAGQFDVQYMEFQAYPQGIR